MSHKKLTATTKQLEKALQSGMTYRQIARFYGVTVRSVILALKREGLHEPRVDRRAVFTLKLSMEEVELLAQLRKHFGAPSNSDALRKALTEAAQSLGLVKGEKSHPR